jgi:allantoate deiminase
MNDLGMRVHVDAAGNLRGIHGDPNAKRLIIASHLDTVPNAGAFDGILGVGLGIALAESCTGSKTGAAIEVIGFSEEEGVRFRTPFIGSRALAGTLDRETLLKRDENDISIEQALIDFGLEPAKLLEAKLAPEAAFYLEFHIEQGPVLDHAGLPLAVVDSIAGQSRLLLTFEGHANHAGTTPMNHRRDALTAAAEWIVAVESLAAKEPGLVATVGSLNVSPNAGNVIPGVAGASLDVRHESDSIRVAAVNRLLENAQRIANRRGLVVNWEQTMDQATVPMDSGLRDRLAKAITAAGYPLHHMASGAGHDAMILAPLLPTAMLFLRSPGGISHHPDEAVLEADVVAALEVGSRFLEMQHA